ncbi:MAG TPA: ABC transporter permease [Flavobacteriales bacterium]|nr:ABC transporter permease [Flavobacteriales bacterium]HIA11780.1 ABC transporter permease [Flavobacteriales bacterium]
MYFKLAWRNIWRNKRRSLITIASILFAVFFAVMMRSIQLGLYSQMIDNVVGFYTGYVQIHSLGYWDEKTLDNSFEYDEGLIDDISKIDRITGVIPRLEGFALSSFGESTKGAMVVGVDPEKEKVMINFHEKIVDGAVFEPTDRSVLMGQGLADYYGLKAFDTLVLLGQGYHGVSAAGKYPVSGIVKFSSPMLNDNLIFLPLKEAQWFYGTDNRITSIVISTDDGNRASTLKASLAEKIDDNIYELMSWEEMMPELVQIIQADSGGGLIMLFILYMVITFGIFGTVLMMTAERTYEFGILLSIGMRRWKISIVLLIETLMMATIGVICGGILAMPLVFYFHNNPIELTGGAAEALLEFGFEAVIPPSTDPSIIITHALIILVITTLITIYPFFIISRLQAASAMRH